MNKVGGLGDVALELPKALIKEGKADAIVITPLNELASENIRRNGLSVRRIQDFCVPLEWKCYKLSIYELSWEERLKIYLIEGEDIEKSPPYPERGNPLYDITFPLFCLGCIESLRRKLLAWEPDIIHIHDWATCFVPIFGRFHKFYRNIKLPPIVLSIHNIAHQGIYETDVIERWHLSSESFSINYLEYWGKVNLLKGGIQLSDALITVSTSYAEEIQEAELGFGLDGVVRANKHKLFGITNGIDQERWDPSKDEEIPFRYSRDNLEGKEKCKERLIQELSLERDIRKPLISMISRIVSQKGFDILIPIIPEILSLGCQLVILGSGDPKITSTLKTMEGKFPSSYRFIDRFDEPLSRRVYAGSDFLLMPSLFEPCGISQMIALRYGTLPIARSTGGLKDTIKDISDGGWGFLFKGYSSEELLQSIRRAIELYKNKQEAFKEAIKRAMALDFSWESRIDLYLKVYEKILGGGINP